MILFRYLGRLQKERASNGPIDKWCSDIYQFPNQLPKCISNAVQIVFQAFKIPLIFPNKRTWSNESLWWPTFRMWNRIWL